jgi:hypothetical protein
MKAENAVRLRDNLVGVEINTIQDVVKAQAAGLSLLNKDGLGYKYEVINEESGEEREPTEQEVFERINKDLSEGNEVYACMFIGDDWCVQEKAATTMRTNFYVGQKVYLMRDNKIVEDEIIYINMVIGGGMEVCKLVLGGNQGHYIKANLVFATKQELVESLMKE